MARGNNVQGPTSALTDFLRDSGITPAFIARRARTANNNAAAAAEPANENDNPTEDNDRAGGRPANGYASDNLDESETEKAAPKKRKLTKAAEAKLKAKKKAGKKDDDDDEEDAYTALSKSMYKTTKPPIGSFEDCVKCDKQFTVTKYTIEAVPPPGFLCHQCAKAAGSDPFKKPAPVRKRKLPADKRKIVNEENRFPSLVSMCIDVITKHIDDVEALGNLSSMNLDAIAKALSRNRSLTPENATLFYDIQNLKLALYDVTKFTPPAFCTLASLNPNLTSLTLQFCGCIDSSAIDAWCTTTPHLTRLELLGPFLVRPPAWQAFFKSHPKLQGFLITQSPRFDLDCMKSLITNCPDLTELRLKEAGLLSNELIEVLHQTNGLTYLDLSYPGKSDALSEDALISLLEQIGSTLTHLNLSGNKNITDVFFAQGLKLNLPILDTLKLANLSEVTDAGVADFFNTWDSPGLIELDLSRNHELASDALDGVLIHSGSRLRVLNIAAWKATSLDSLMSIPDKARGLVKVDLGWCRAVDDFVIKGLMEKCVQLKEIQCWGCNNIHGAFPRKRKINVYGVETQS